MYRSLAVAGLLILSLGGCAQGSTATTTITGTVSCVANQPIQGIWISVLGRGESPPSGPADWTQLDNETVSFTRSEMPSPSTYTVHVACGQPDAFTNHASGNLQGNNHKLVCGPTPLCTSEP